MKAKSKEIQHYIIRESSRAKHVCIKVSHLGEIEVVLPQGFDRRQVPEIVAKRKDWILKTTQRIALERQSVPSGMVGSLPETIHLRSVSEDWTVRYQPTSGRVTSANFQELYKKPKTSSEPNILSVNCSTDDIATCREILKDWLSRQAKQHFGPWIRHLSKRSALPYKTISIRGQKTRWASCSSQKTISLNYKLLFLPPDLVRYVLIHELCHTIHLNHSAKFWSLVAEKEPGYQQLDMELNKAWRYIPEWVDDKL